jgi:hypothetical protein
MHQSLTIKELIELIEKAESRINSYWNFYTIVVIAIVGWLMSSQTPFSLHQTMALTLALVVFFCANFGVMRAATIRILALEDELAAVARETEFVGESLKRVLSRAAMPGRLGWSYGLHVIVDVTVIFAVWSKLT